MTDMTPASVQVKQYPVSEIFGPTIQGEGPNAGRRTFFFRVAGCDYDACSWCDTLYAVNKKYAGWKRDMMTLDQIRDKFIELGVEPGDTITLSGGNPALFIDRDFMLFFPWLHFAMETQGSKALPLEVNLGIETMVISPKPPSSKMAMKLDPEILLGLMEPRLTMQRNRREQLFGNDLITALKFVVFDEEDLAWIRALDVDLSTRLHTPETYSRYLSIGTIQSEPTPERILSDYRRVVELVKRDPVFKRYTVLPQLHVLLWEKARGV